MSRQQSESKAAPERETLHPDPAELVLQCVERIARRNGEIGAWVSIRSDAAVEEARTIGLPTAARPLAGMPIGVKDVFDTVDLPTTYGSAVYEGFRPAADAACVALARQAGAVVLGKTTTTEFAAVAPCGTKNPHDTRHTPGGSSSGSAAAVAAGMVPFAFGTQTAGSIIRPSSYCGVVGFKPSFGAIPRAGLKTLADSLDTVGVIAANVADVALFASVVSGRHYWRDLEAVVPRIALCRTPLWEDASNDVTGAILTTLEELRARGCAIGEVDAPADYLELIQSHISIMAWEVPQSLADELRRYPERLDPKTLAFVKPGPPVNAEAYDRAMDHAARARNSLDGLFADCDVLATLAAMDTAPLGLGNTGNPICNRAWTTLHVPCISVPIGRGSNGLPIGLQLVGRPGADAHLLHSAAFVEAALAHRRGDYRDTGTFTALG